MLDNLLERFKPQNTTPPPLARESSFSPTSTGSFLSTGDYAVHARRDLLKLVLRETVQFFDVQRGWVKAEVLTSRTPEGDERLHVRFVLRHWDPGFAVRMKAFEDEYANRVEAFDPTSHLWLAGYSWRFDLPRAPLHI